MREVRGGCDGDEGPGHAWGREWRIPAPGYGLLPRGCVVPALPIREPVTAGLSRRAVGTHGAGACRRDQRVLCRAMGRGRPALRGRAGADPGTQGGGCWCPCWKAEGGEVVREWSRPHLLRLLHPPCSSISCPSPHPASVRARSAPGADPPSSLGTAGSAPPVPPRSMGALCWAVTAGG